MTARSVHILSRPIQMYVRQGMILFATAYALLNGSVLNAQVVNDDCSTATDLGLLQVQPTCMFNNGDGTPMAVPFTDSTTLAVPDFPYPAMPLTCEGYAPAVTVPSNDMWYTFIPGCYFSMEVEPGPGWPTDTVHLSLWTGAGCGQLTPVKCYTLAANTSLNDSQIPFFESRYYLQVSSPSLTATSRFSICLRALSYPCAPSVFSTGDPTPVLCFPYELNLVNAQEAGGTGSATIILDDLYGPYAITWSDGITEALSRTDLTVGDQAVTITNSEGCTVMIPYTIALDPTMAIGQHAGRSTTLYYADQELHIQFGSIDRLPVQVEVFNARGALEAEQRVKNVGRMHMDITNTGVHFVRVRYADGSNERFSFVVM